MYKFFDSIKQKNEKSKYRIANKRTLIRQFEKYLEKAPFNMRTNSKKFFHQKVKAYVYGDWEFNYDY
jgi:hypothetical protein